MNKDTIKTFVRKGLRSRGWDLVPFSRDSSSAYRRSLLLRSEGIDLVIDVGANVGQFGRDVRTAGYKGRLVSLEPIGDAFAELSRRAAGDAQWQTLNIALSDTSGVAEINVSGNSVSSSLLPILKDHTARAPTSGYVRTEAITCKTLDDIWHEIAASSRKPLLKIDVQGHEAAVLAGAREALRHVHAIEIEMSLVELYEGQMLFWDLDRLLLDEGFSLFALEPGFTDPQTGRVLQMDGIFVRSTAQVMQRKEAPVLAA